MMRSLNYHILFLFSWTIFKSNLMRWHWYINKRISMSMLHRHNYNQSCQANKVQTVSALSCNTWSYRPWKNSPYLTTWPKPHIPYLILLVPQINGQVMFPHVVLLIDWSRDENHRINNAGFKYDPRLFLSRESITLTTLQKKIKGRQIDRHTQCKQISIKLIRG